MAAKRRALNLMALGMTLWLAGCAGSPPPPQQPLLRLEAHGDSLSEARRAAMQRAEERCQAGEPVVIDSQQYDTPPRFRSESALPLAQSELGQYAAATHEGEAPSIVWRYLCR
ncbi:MAG: hypothetical protein U9Q35_10730 [Pseudomonadota bacterium]|jgi:hypothetical protein|uniref:hypothetical protein n=1 Tax=Halomonas sp. IOP_31 TaxID=2876584 RepID=UPI001E4BD9BD|nr:hypothetical protein [Halomonas sp. IOP_31]MCD6008783.1 hypothetical protein [Halomonas sp. IOP_31]MEA3252021.1 hypothetical protein [Pseudomonadota bacterium]